MRNKLMSGLMAALAAAMLLAGCTAGGDEVKAQKAQLKQATERLATVENQIKQLRDDIDIVSIELGNQKQSGGTSPELARRIDEMSTKLSSLESGLGDVNSMKAALSETRRQQTTAVASAPSESKPAAATVSKPQTQGVYHKVQSGETLTSIAEKYGTTIAAIRKENGLPQNAVIRSGAKLYVPTEKQ